SRTQIVEATPFIRRDGGASRRVVQFLHDLMPAARIEAAARAVTPEQVEPLLEIKFHWCRGETQPASALGLLQEPVDQSREDTTGHRADGCTVDVYLGSALMGLVDDEEIELAEPHP